MDEKVRINKLRRAARRQGLRLRRSRTPDVLALDYGFHLMRGDREVAQLPSLDSLERWLTDPASRRGRRVQA